LYHSFAKLAALPTIALLVEQSKRYRGLVIITVILLLGFWLWPEALLPSFLQMLQADVAYALVCALRIAQIVDRSLYRKERWSGSGAKIAISHCQIISYGQEMEVLIV